MSTPELDAKILLKEALQEKNYNFIISNAKIPMSAEIRFKKMVNKRSLGKPVSRIISKRSFWNSDFFINSFTLDPRSDSETLVSSTIKMAKTINSSPLQILDLGTGSGCLILSLLQSLPDSKGVGSDINSESLKVAQKNASNLKLDGKVKFILSDWGKNIENTIKDIERVIKELATEYEWFNSLDDVRKDQPKRGTQQRDHNQPPNQHAGKL